MPCLRFSNAMFTLRKSHVYASQIACLRIANAMFTIFKRWCFGLQTCFAEDEKNVKTEAFLPQFCTNIQNDRKTVNKALRFQNAQNYS